MQFYNRMSWYSKILGLNVGGTKCGAQNVGRKLWGCKVWVRKVGKTVEAMQTTVYYYYLTYDLY